jgi:hypothetical protein
MKLMTSVNLSSPSYASMIPGSSSAISSCESRRSPRLRRRRKSVPRESHLTIDAVEVELVEGAEKVDRLELDDALDLEQQGKRVRAHAGGVRRETARAEG